MVKKFLVWSASVAQGRRGVQCQSTRTIRRCRFRNDAAFVIDTQGDPQKIRTFIETLWGAVISITPIRSRDDRYRIRRRSGLISNHATYRPMPSAPSAETGNLAHGRNVRRALARASGPFWPDDLITDTSPPPSTSRCSYPAGGEQVVLMNSVPTGHRASQASVG